MTSKGSPQINFLAVTGLAADPRGKLVTPPRGPLNLSWLFRVSAEATRQARERLAEGNVSLDGETLAGWFCVATPADMMALEQLEQKAWRKAFKIWKTDEGARWNRHNRATLHRLMYLSEDSENQGGHLRKTVELYHRLVQETEAEAYRPLAAWASLELQRAIVAASKAGDDDMVAKSLLLVSQTQGMVACEDLQESLLLSEIDDLALQAATLIKELLPFQGVVHAPPRGMLASAQETTELDVLPPAVRLSFRLVPGSRQRRRLEAMIAELCGLLAQSLFKADQGHAGKKWQGEAQRWEPQIAERWSEPSKDHLGDEPAANVEFNDPDASRGSEDDGPRSWGPRWLGISGKPTRILQHEAREEWLEAARLLGVAVFPLRRFAVYRNLDTGELGHAQRLPLKMGHYIWQMLLVVLLSFTLAGVAVNVWPRWLPAASDPATATLDPVQRKDQLEKAVERLKRLALVEAELRQAAKLDTKKMEAIEAERQALFSKVQSLEESDTR